MSEFLDWQLRVTDVPQQGLTGERTATEVERAALVQDLGLQALSRLSLSYRVTGQRQGGYHLKGELVAEIEQACVVTLETIHSRVVEPIDVAFMAGEAAVEEGAEQTVLDKPDVELFDGMHIPVGRIAFETLAAAIDPYPRKPGAEFSWSGNDGLSAELKGPFSVLSKLKDQS